MSGIYHSWNGTVLTITSDSGTSSADLQGEMGVRGPQGVSGGFSPIVEVEEVENGNKVTITDEEGEKSFTVDNGISPTVYVGTMADKSTYIGITDADGTEHSAVISNGVSPTIETSFIPGTPETKILYITDVNGKKTVSWEEGYTPIKGIDYWTEADKAEIIAETNGVYNITSIDTIYSSVEDLPLGVGNGTNYIVVNLDERAIYSFDAKSCIWSRITNLKSNSLYVVLTGEKAGLYRYTMGDDVLLRVESSVEEWVVLADTTTTKAIAGFGIDADMDGNAFSCKKIKATLQLPSVMGKNIQFSFGSGTGCWQGRVEVMECNITTTACVFLDFQVDVIPEELAVLTCNQRVNEVFQGNASYQIIREDNPNANRYITSSLTSFHIASISAYNQSTEEAKLPYLLPVGTKIKVWGCKA